MNCKKAKSHVALLIGQDLEPAVAEELRNHLDQCGDCHDHYRQMASCLEVLQTPEVEAWNTPGDSLWPQLSVRLAARPANRKPHRYSGWAPSLAVAAACTAMFWVAYRPLHDVAPVRTMRVQPVTDEYSIPPELFQIRSRHAEQESDLSNPRQLTPIEFPILIDESQR